MHRSLFLIILMGQCRPTSSACQSHVYHFVNQSKNWSEAQSYCREKHTDLAIINDMEDVKLLNDLVDGVNNEPAWIGLEKTGERRWHWPKPVPHELNEKEAQWSDGEPNNFGGNENCVVMKHEDHTWADVSCDDKFHFICQNENGFHLIKETINWINAKNYCEENDNHLASPKDEEENSGLKVLQLQHDHATIGLTAFSDPWKWSDGSNASFKHWQTKFKENPRQSRNCAVTNLTDEGKWNASNCSEKLPFFCYGELGCLDGWKKVNGSCYRYFACADILNWSAAEQHCQGHNAHLASIHSQKEQDFVYSHTPAGTQWIGLHDTDGNGTFKWTDGSSEDYTNWAEGRPEQNTKECVMIRGGECHECHGKWHATNDFPCSERLSFTCKSIPDNLILIKRNMTWFDAVDYCRANHDDLVSVQNASEQERVRQRVKMADTPHVWLGMHYSCPFDFWFWLSDDDSCNRNWAPGNGTGSCGMAVAVERGGNQSWVHLHHDNKFNFICVRK